MHIHDIFQRDSMTFSFEFYPPKTHEAWEELFERVSEFESLSPSFVSVTYGAGGSTRDRTHDLVVKMKAAGKLDPVPHLTTVGHKRDEVHQILERYTVAGVSNIMALRGDPPKGEVQFVKTENGFEYAAELVAYIKKHFPHMGVGVAGFPEGHPTTPNRLKEIDHLKAKVDAGADYICTQLFFDNRDYYDFCERCDIAGIKVPIIAGIMPVSTRKGLARMAEFALGARFPAKLLRAVARAEDDESVEKVGIHWATEQVRDLIDRNVAGIHFYTLNRSRPTLKIYDSLGIKSSDSLRKAPVPLL